MARVFSLAVAVAAATAAVEALASAAEKAAPAVAATSVRFPVPPRGFNPCNSLGCNMRELGEATLREVADSIATNGMLAAGFTYFCLDDGWQAAAREADGSITADPVGFPSGMAALAAHVRSRGLKFGLYTDRGTATCEGRPGSRGHEAQDAATYASWGVEFVKSDSCSASGVHGAAYEDYSLMGHALRAVENASAPIYFTLCGWNMWYATLGALPPGLAMSDGWRIGTDVPDVDRFLQNVEAAAAVGSLVGFGRGWPDVDMIGGQWSPDEERLHLSFVALVGAPLLLSWNVSDPIHGATLPLADYLNQELLAVHQDPLAGDASQLAGGASAAAPFYFARLSGGAVTSVSPSVPALPAVTGADCGTPQAQWLFSEAAEGAGGAGWFESSAQPGWCLAIWNEWQGGCVDPEAAQLVRCNATVYGCGPAAQQWSPANVSGLGPVLASSLNPWPAGTSMFPGPYLTHDTLVPGGLYVQPILNASNSLPAPLGQMQTWQTAAHGALAAKERRKPLLGLPTTIMGSDGTCLAAPAPGGTNVWARWLEGGDVALLLFNVGPAPAAVTCDPACLTAAATARGGGASSVPASWAVRDVWARADASPITTAQGYTTPPLPAAGGSLLLRLTPAAA